MNLTFGAFDEDECFREEPQLPASSQPQQVMGPAPPTQGAENMDLEHYRKVQDFLGDTKWQMMPSEKNERQQWLVKVKVSLKAHDIFYLCDAQEQPKNLNLAKLKMEKWISDLLYNALIRIIPPRMSNFSGEMNHENMDCVQLWSQINITCAQGTDAEIQTMVTLHRYTALNNQLVEAGETVSLET